MKKLTTLIEKLKAFESGIFKLIEGVIRENEGIIVEMNSEDQLFEQGIYRDGEKLDGYSPYTIEIKGTKGQPTDRTTLRDTGDFHESFYIEFTASGFEIKARDPKTEDLKADWGVEILGLTDDNLQDLIHSYVAPILFKKFKDTIQ